MPLEATDAAHCSGRRARFARRKTTCAVCFTYRFTFKIVAVALSYARASLSYSWCVRLSVRLSQAGNASKLMNLGFCSFHPQLTQGLYQPSCLRLQGHLTLTLEIFGWKTPHNHASMQSVITALM